MIGQLGIGMGSDSKEKNTWCPLSFGNYDMEELKKGNKRKTIDKKKGPPTNTSSTNATRQSVFDEDMINAPTEEVVLSSAGGKSIISFYNSNKTFIWGFFEYDGEKLGSDIIFPEEIKKFSDIQILNVFSFSNQIVLSIGIQNLPSLKFSSFDPPVVQRGTPQALVDYLFEDPIDYTYQTQFLLTYPSKKKNYFYFIFLFIILFIISISFFCKKYSIFEWN